MNDLQTGNDLDLERNTKFSVENGNDSPLSSKPTSAGKGNDKN